MKLQTSLVLLTAVLTTGTIARAAVLTSPSQLSASNTTITFETFSSGLTTNPLVIGSATFSSATPLTIEDITSYTANGTTVFHNILRSNGSNPFGFGGYSDIKISFASPVGEVGMGWFDPNVTGNILEVYDSTNTLLESAPIPIGPAGGSFATFRGIHRPTNDIAYAFARSVPSDPYGIDNVSFGQVKPTPEPSSLAVFGIGAAVLTACMNRRKAKSPARRA